MAEQRKFTVVANQDADLAELGFEQTQRATANHVPVFAFETRHDLFVLDTHFARRRKEPCAIHRAVTEFRIEHRRRGGKDIDVEFARQIGVQRVCGGNTLGHRVKGLFQIASRLKPRQSRQFHRSVFRKHQQTRAIFRRFRHPAAYLGRVISPILEHIQRIGRCRDLERFARAHSSRIQNCRS